MLAAIPGPDIATAMVLTLSRGARQALMFVSGLMSGLLFHIGLSAAGVSALLVAYPQAITVVKWCGVAYLVYLAWSAALASTNSASKESAESGNWYLKGIMMNVSNPKVTLFFLAYLPPFVQPDGWPAWAQIITLGVVFILSAFPVFLAAVVAARWLARFTALRPESKQMKAANVALFVLLAALLAFL